MFLRADWGMAKLTGAFLQLLVVKQFAVNGLVQRERCDLYSGVVRLESVIIVPMVFLSRARQIQGYYLLLSHQFIIHLSSFHFTS
jgi:hypothetical protein